MQDHAERPDVRALVDRASRADLLGRRVAGGAGDAEVPRRGRHLGAFELRHDHHREAEVEHLHVRRPVGADGEEEVRRLDVPVDDAKAVRLRKRVAGLQDDVARVHHRHRAALEQLPADVAPEQPFHHEEGAPVRQDADLEEPHRVRAREAHRELRFHQQVVLARQLLRAGRLGHDLDGHDPARLEVERLVDGRGAPAADRITDAVPVRHHASGGQLRVGSCLRHGMEGAAAGHQRRGVPR